MELNLNELLKGKATVIRGKEYLSAEAYAVPFLERMSKLFYAQLKKSFGVDPFGYSS